MTSNGHIPVIDKTPANRVRLTDAKATSGMSVARLAAALAMGGGGLVLVGWALDIAALKSVLPGWVSMKPNSALAFILTGIALWFSAFSLQPSAFVSRLSQMCGWLAGLIGLLTLIEFAFGWNPGFDQWLFREPAGPAGTLYPGRMAPDAALCFLLLAAGMEIARYSRGRTGMYIASAILGLLVTIVALFEILSYFTPVLRLYGWWGWTMMALPTATLFAALSAAVVLRAWLDTSGLRLTKFTSYLWWMAGCVGVLTIAFALSARAIKQANLAYELRYQSFLLADELRQSSDDLTRMVRTYVVTGAPLYQKHYQDILDIRNGKKSRPEGYWKIYWDLMLPGGPAPHRESQPAIPLLELMRQAGFTEEEFRKLAEAAANSDGLTSLEFEAMKLAESTGPNAEASRARARRMMFDDNYHQAKAAIMKPIDEFFVLLDQRTLAAVQTAENIASIFRYVFAAFGLGLMFMLWRTYLALCDILGRSVDEVRAHITKIGSGDFSTIIKVKDSRKNSVLGWLSATQANLNNIARERKQAEEAMREKEYFLSESQRLGHIGSWLIDGTGQMFWSEELYRVFGVSPDTCIPTAESLISLILPDDRPAMQAWIAACAAGEKPGELEFRVNMPDGTIRFIRGHGDAVHDAGHRLIRMAGTGQDITERKRMEQALWENEARMRLQSAALESAANGVAITDPQGTIQWINPAFTQLTGYSAKEAIGQNPRVLKSGRHPESFYAEMWNAISTGHPWKGEMINRHKSGQLYHEEMTITPVRDASGATTHFIAVKQDITERKRAQAELEDVHQQLVEASRRGGMAEIATNVLHNVGNVLNSVNVSADLIVESVRKSRTSSLARVVGLLQEHAHDLGTFITQDPRGKHVPAHLAQISEHLLADQTAMVSELDALRGNVEHIKEIVAMQQNYAMVGGVKELVNVVQLVEDSLRLNEGAFSRHGVEVIREFETVPLLNVEKHKILQILVNLERNAKYACDDSGRVDKRLTVRVTDGEGRVKISVMDNGIGISPENLTRIFNHGFTTRKGGHGFGLHSSALAAQEMGGSLTVHSDGPGQGAAFTLELPCPRRET